MTPNTPSSKIDNLLDRAKAISERREQLHSIVPLEADAIKSAKAIHRKLLEEFGEQLELKAAIEQLLVEARIDELQNFNLPQYDHSKCPTAIEGVISNGCIGYENARSDFDNEKEIRLAELQSLQGKVEL